MEGLGTEKRVVHVCSRLSYVATLQQEPQNPVLLVIFSTKTTKSIYTSQSAKSSVKHKFTLCSEHDVKTRALRSIARRAIFFVRVDAKYLFLSVGQLAHLHVTTHSELFQ